jgi:glycerol-3-phosphate acyltransferase PlsY
VFAGFRGGRGSATIIGIFLVLAPRATLITLAVVAIPFFTSHNFAGAIMVGFALLPLLLWLLEGSLDLVRYVLVIDLFMLVRNLSGIKQILAKGIVRDMIYDRQRKEVK